MDPFSPCHLLDSTSRDSVPPVREPGPPADGYMWSIDAPRVTGGPGLDQAVFDFRANFEEFVRVSFDGTDPTENGVKGSRASPKFRWHATHRLAADGAGWWQRTTGDQEVAGVNDVAEGHVEIENYDPLNP